MPIKLTLELDLPAHDGASYEDLERNAAIVVRTWKSLMSEYKGPTPSIYLRSAKRGAKEVDPSVKERKEFVNALLDYHKLHMPKDDLSKQAIPVNQLFALGYSVDQLKAIYDTCKQEFEFTTWFTVRKRVNDGFKAETHGSGEFVRSEITDQQKEDLRKRLSSYSPPDERESQGTT